MMLRRSSRLLSRVVCDTRPCTRTELLQIKHFSSEHFELQHDAPGKCFFVSLGEDRAVVEYQKLSLDTLDLVHTEVPEIFKGRGVGKVLAKGVFDYVVENNMKMKLTCEFLLNYYKKNPLPEYKACFL